MAPQSQLRFELAGPTKPLISTSSAEMELVLPKLSDWPADSLIHWK